MAVLMTLLVGSQQLHMLLIEHEVCVDHGHIAHTDDEHHEGPEASTSKALGGQTAVSSEHEDAHDHCDALATESTHAALHSGQQIERIPYRVQPLLVSLSIVVDRRQLLLRAPKTSPPVC